MVDASVARVKHDASKSQRHADALDAASREAIVINVSDSFDVHDRTALRCRIFLTPGLHALCGELPLSPVLYVDCVGGIRVRGPLLALGLDHLAG